MVTLAFNELIFTLFGKNKKFVVWKAQTNSSH